ncbi:HAD family hydrolase [Glaciibacter superstes]|uniref:HAD family hydrolase n=1 Tax=Glaciibacter superstes TaxID=501023 RepID=UPI0003B75100|nr:HAD family hydrolase [Glaciibacter superstes]
MTSDNPTRPQAVLFDIDGTLVDSNYLHVDAWSRAFVAVGHSVAAWRVHRAIGMGSAELLAALVGDDAEQIADEVKRLHGVYLAESASLLRPFERARELLRTVAAWGTQVVLATSADPNELEHLLRVLDSDESVSVVTSAADVDAAKPNPDLLNAALEKAGVSAADAVMLGDAVWDVQAAGHADCLRQLDAPSTPIPPQPDTESPDSALRWPDYEQSRATRRP